MTSYSWYSLFMTGVTCATRCSLYQRTRSHLLFLCWVRYRPFCVTCLVFFHEFEFSHCDIYFVGFLSDCVDLSKADPWPTKALRLFYIWQVPYTKRVMVTLPGHLISLSLLSLWYWSSSFLMTCKQCTTNFDKLCFSSQPCNWEVCCNCWTVGFLGWELCLYY